MTAERGAPLSIIPAGPARDFGIDRLALHPIDAVLAKGTLARAPPPGDDPLVAIPVSKKGRWRGAGLTSRLE
jgi:hypothetical protein